MFDCPSHKIACQTVGNKGTLTFYNCCKYSYFRVLVDDSQFDHVILWPRRLSGQAGSIRTVQEVRDR